MKILFVSSNLHSQFPACFPNGVGALSAYLKELGHQVQALHMGRERDESRLPELLEQFSPDVVGISAVTCETPIIERVARTAKQWDPAVPVLVGGIHAIVAPDSVMECEDVDAVCCGEGELAITEYLRRLEAGEDLAGIGNFITRDGPELVRGQSLEFIQDLDNLPLMDRSVTDLQEVIEANNGVLNVIFSRGCPWTCKFCCNRDIKKAGTGNYARVNSVQRAVNELELLAGKYEFRHVLFRDDTFTWNREWSLEFVQAYKASSLKVPFDIFSRVDCLDDELLEALADGGCQHIFIGLDSGSDFIRNEVLHKEQENENLLPICEKMKALGITPMISNIVGLPYETPEMFKDTIAVNKLIHRDMVVFSPTCGACPKIWVFTPWPGSELYNLCEREGWLEEKAGVRKVYRESTLRMPTFPAAEIDRQYRRFRYNVYKDSFPLHALLYLIYDSSTFQSVFERIPMGLIGGVRQSVLTVMNPGKRREFIGSLLGASGIPPRDHRHSHP